jgi:hypothetical protein
MYTNTQTHKFTNKQQKLLHVAAAKLTARSERKEFAPGGILGANTEVGSGSIFQLLFPHANTPKYPYNYDPNSTLN